MSGEIHAGARHAQIPHDLACGDHERGDQRAGAVADVFVFAFFGLAGSGEFRGMLSLKDLHASLFVAANDQLTVLIQDGSLNVESANVLSLGVEVGIVAVEPVDAAMRFQVGCIQNTPDGGTAHLIFGVLVDQVGCQIVDAPLAGDAVMFGGLAGGERDDFELSVGGKSFAADRTAERLEDRRDRAGDSGFAKESRCCDCNPSRWPLASWKVDPGLPTARSVGNERPTLAGRNGLGSKLAAAFVLQGPRQSPEQMGLA